MFLSENNEIHLHFDDTDDRITYIVKKEIRDQFASIGITIDKDYDIPTAAYVNFRRYYIVICGVTSTQIALIKLLGCFEVTGIYATHADHVVYYHGEEIFVYTNPETMMKCVDVYFYRGKTESGIPIEQTEWARFA